MLENAGVRVGEYIGVDRLLKLRHFGAPDDRPVSVEVQVQRETAGPLGAGGGGGVVTFTVVDSLAEPPALRRAASGTGEPRS